jgi:hypothetical protein
VSGSLATIRKSFRFTLKSDGHSVGGFSRCTGLATSSTKLELVMLERGVTRNAAFASWIGKPTETWGADKRKRGTKHRTRTS